MTSSPPEISVIMPARNAAKTIDESIKSILTQDMPSWELIIIDDGSTDKTAEIIINYKKQDSRIRLIKGKAEGVSAARNKGLDAAKGQYIAFLDADDIMSNDSLSGRLVTIKAQKNRVAAYCDVLRTDETFQPLSLNSGDSHKNKIDFKDMYSAPLSMISILIHHDFIKNHRFNTGITNGEDWLFIAHIAQMGVVFHKATVGVCYYRTHNNSTVKRNFLRHYRGLEEVLNLLYSSNSGCPRPDPLYKKGLKTPNKFQALLPRQIGVLWWLILDGKLENKKNTSNINKIIEELAINPASKMLTMHMVVQSLKTTASRYFIVPREQAYHDIRQKHNFIDPQIEHIKDPNIRVLLKAAIRQTSGPFRLILSFQAKIKLKFYRTIKRIISIIISKKDI